MPPASNRGRETPAVPTRIQPGREAKSRAQAPKPAEKEAPTCSICLGKLPKKVTSIDCSHSFHQACIKQWIDVPNRSCPNCRAPVTFMQCGKKRTTVEPIEEPLPHIRFLSVPRTAGATGLVLHAPVHRGRPLDASSRRAVEHIYLFSRSSSPDSTMSEDDPPRTGFPSFLAAAAGVAAMERAARERAANR